MACAIIACALLAPPLGAEPHVEPFDVPTDARKGEAIMVRKTPVSVYYDASESRFYFYEADSETDGRAGCSPAFIGDSIPEGFRGDYWQLQPQPHCGEHALDAKRLEGAQRLSFAKNEQNRPAGWTVLHEAGLALGARFSGRLPATEIALFSMKDLTAQVFRLEEENAPVAALVLTETKSGRELRLLRGADGDYAVAKAGQRIPTGMASEQISVVRWSEAEVFVAFNDAPPIPSGQLQASAYAIIPAPELARKLGGRPLNVPLRIRMVPAPAAGGGESVAENESQGEEYEQQERDSCLTHEDSCVCLDPDMLCATAAFPFIWVLYLDAFSD